MTIPEIHSGMERVDDFIRLVQGIWRWGSWQGEYEKLDLKSRLSGYSDVQHDFNEQLLSAANRACGVTLPQHVSFTLWEQRVEAVRADAFEVLRSYNPHARDFDLVNKLGSSIEALKRLAEQVRVHHRARGGPNKPSGSMVDIVAASPFLTAQRLTKSEEQVLAEIEQAREAADLQPPVGISSVLATAYREATDAFQVCTRAFALSPFFTTANRRAEEYHQLAGQLAAAAERISNAYFATEIPLVVAGEPNVFLALVNAVRHAAACVPLNRDDFKYIALQDVTPKLVGENPIGRLREHVIRANRVQLAHTQPEGAGVLGDAGPPAKAPTVTPDPTKESRLSRDEIEIRVRDAIQQLSETSAPAAITRDVVATRANVSTGSVSKSSAWKVFAAKKRPPAAPRTIPMTDDMLAVIGTSSDNPAELEELIREQQAEQAEESRRHNRRHGAS